MLSARLESAASAPISSAASQLVISMRRLWPALAAAPLRLVCTSSVPSAGPSRYVPGGIATCRL